jgi:hypothetical protein
MHYLSALFAVLAASSVQASVDIVSGGTWTAVMAPLSPTYHDLILTLPDQHWRTCPSTWSRLDVSATPSLCI